MLDYVTQRTVNTNKKSNLGIELLRAYITKRRYIEAYERKKKKYEPIKYIREMVTGYKESETSKQGSQKMKKMPRIKNLQK